MSIESDIESSGYHPLQEDILNLVRGATLNNNGDTFFRVVIASNLAQIAGAMRAKIKDALGEETLLNLYVCGTMPSGSGKSQAQNKILDDITQGLAAFKNCKFGMVVACAAGKGADQNVLKKITESVVSLDTADSATIKSFFKWVSASISTSSMKVEEGGRDIGGTLNELPPPPPEVNIVV